MSLKNSLPPSSRPSTSAINNTLPNNYAPHHSYSAAMVDTRHGNKFHGSHVPHNPHRNHNTSKTSSAPNPSPSLPLRTTPLTLPHTLYSPWCPKGEQDATHCPYPQRNSASNALVLLALRNGRWQCVDHQFCQGVGK